MLILFLPLTLKTGMLHKNNQTNKQPGVGIDYINIQIRHEKFPISLHEYFLN